MTVIIVIPVIVDRMGYDLVIVVIMIITGKVPQGNERG